MGDGVCGAPAGALQLTSIYLYYVPGEEPRGAPEDPFQQPRVAAAHQLDDITWGWANS